MKGKDLGDPNGCLMCHGGNPNEERDPEAAHQGAPEGDPRETCASCHNRMEKAGVCMSCHKDVTPGFFSDSMGDVLKLGSVFHQKMFEFREEQEPIGGEPR